MNKKKLQSNQELYQALNVQGKFTTGFTLIEVMVAVTIFTLVMVVSLGAILAIVSANRKAQSLHNVISNVNLAVETMARDLRTGYSYRCGTPTGTCNPALPYDQIHFNSYQVGESVSPDGDPVPVVYKLEVVAGVGSIKKSVAGGLFEPITSPAVDIDHLNFKVFGVGIGGDPTGIKQPRIIMTVKGKVLQFGQKSEFSIQTLISQRLLDAS